MRRHRLLGLVSLLGLGCAPATAARTGTDTAASEPEVAARSADEGDLPSPRGNEACVVGIQTDARPRLAAMLSEVVSPDPALSMSPLPDADGDGASEEMWVPEHLCGVTGNCPRLVYLSNHGCRTHAASLFAAYLSVEPGDGIEHGALETWTKNGCAGMAGEWARYAWDGESGEYRVERTVECPCPFEDDDGAELVGLVRAPQCPRL